MTEVSFHFNVSDRTQYTCRLLRKAQRKGASVVVTGPVAALASLDQALWTFDPLEFVPHVMLPRGVAATDRLRGTPIWLLEDTAAAPRHDVLVNLGAEAPDGFESFARVIELVSADADDRAAARRRWKHYGSRGYPIQSHEVGAE